MSSSVASVSLISSAWEVFLLFTIPVGGGIPAGVLLGQSRALSWPILMGLYFASDVALACVFEPLMKLFIHAGKRSLFLARVREAFKKSMSKSVSSYGINPSPLSLILISFGVDPMTGRAAAKAAGHGFVAGWALAITGDMFFFTIIMASTLWLNHILGDGTWTAVIIMVAMMVIPSWFRRRSLQ
jgi:hypothetical protein